MLPSAPFDWKIAPAQLKTRWTDQVSPTNARPEYPRPQMVRKDWLNLNGLWQFQIGELQDPPIGQTLKEQILVPFPMESALSGIEKHADHIWYRRTFTIPKNWAGQHVLLHFGAVDWETTVWLNGKKIGVHRGGYDPFSFDLTDALKPGENELIVGVTDPTDSGTQPIGKQRIKPHGIFYTPTTGIWQTVWLEPVPSKAHIEDFVITPDVDAGAVRIKVIAPGATEANIDVLDGGQVIATRASQSLDNIVLPMPGAHLWSPDDPHLYDLRIDIDRGADSVQSYFGMRKIEIKSDGKFNRIFLNNKFVPEIGLLDQGFWPDGIYTAPTDEAMKYDLQMTKKLGFNLIRKHVKVEPATWYAACDRLGILVWQDMPSTFDSKTDDAKKEFESELDRLIETHRNSPSIILWIVFNEGWGEYDAERLTKHVQDLDPTRLVNNASGWFDAKAGNIADMHKYPGPGAPQPDPKRAAVLGEFGGLGLEVSGHTWIQKAGEHKNFSYHATTDTAQLTEQYCKLYGRLWNLIEQDGLSASIYTQTTDVEGEINGIMTYDREVLKLDPDKARQANTGKIPRITTAPIVPTAESDMPQWKYSTTQPSNTWMKADFDDSKWLTGTAGFGVAETTKGAITHTGWNTPTIWLRRQFDLPANVPTDRLMLREFHNENCSIYLNGVLAAQGNYPVGNYVDQQIKPEAAGHC